MVAGFELAARKAMSVMYIYELMVSFKRLILVECGINNIYIKIT